jgi:hypothetical protein
MEIAQNIKVGTVLGGGEGSDVRVVAIWICRNNSGKWDTLTKFEFLDPQFGGQHMQVPMKELVKGLDSGELVIKKP